MEAIVDIGFSLLVSPLLAYFGYKVIITYTEYLFIWYFIVIYMTEAFLLRNLL